MILLRRNYESRKINILKSHVNENRYTEDINHKEQVAFDLHIGDGYQKPNDHTPINSNEGITINPGACVLISTAESITLPPDVFGIICSRGSLAAKGLFVGNTKIDPTFSGTLNIPVFNAGNKVIRMKKGDAFCTTFFTLLEQPVPSGAVKKAPGINPESLTWGSRLYDFLRINGLVLLINILIAVVGTYTATKAALPPKNESITVQESSKK